MASMKDRAMYARTMIEMGLMSPNEWRDMEGMDPRPGGDEYLRPLNLTSGSESEAEGDEESEGDGAESDQPA